MNNRHRLKIGLLLIVAAFVSIPSAMAIQDPYPLYGYVVYENGTPVGAGANVTFTNQNTGEVISDDTSASGWYMDDAANFPSGYQNGQTITYSTVFGEYTNTTSHVIDVVGVSHMMNITLDTTLDTMLDSDADGVPDAWDTEPNTPIGYWTDSQGRGRMLGDMNGDGKLSSVDALMILQLAVKGL